MFSHDTEHSLQVVVDLVNTAPEFGGSEELQDAEALHEFVQEHHVSGVGTLTPTDVASVHAVRKRFGTFFYLADPTDAATAVNSLLSEATVQPRLSRHDSYDWHMHYFPPDATLAEHLAVDGGMALAHVVTEEETDRLSVCAAPDCDAVLVDLSRNRSKRYCDARSCGNRLHVAAYRERKRNEQLEVEDA